MDPVSVACGKCDSVKSAGRVGQPNDVAQLCLFLADESKAKFITGQDFAIDGGVSKKLIYPE